MHFMKNPNKTKSWVLALYRQYYVNRPDDAPYIKVSAEDSLRWLQANPSILDELTIELPIGVIQLRNIGDNDELLLGCGNSLALDRVLVNVQLHSHYGYE